jgi:hypothetical protein
MTYDEMDDGDEQTEKEGKVIMPVSPRTRSRFEEKAGIG